MRAIWSGSVAFGLVNIPVKLYSAVSQKEVRFNMLHGKDGARIEMKRFCSAEGKEVPYKEIVKGFPLSKTRYVTVTREELEALDPKATRTIEIERFVDLAEIDPIYYEQTYYLVPDKGAAKAYALLMNAMEEMGKVAIARMVLRTKQYLCAVRPLGGRSRASPGDGLRRSRSLPSTRALSVSTMLYADEVVPASELEGLPERGAKPAKREGDMAQQLIESLTGPFDPKEFKDTYRERVQELLDRKAEGETIEAPEQEQPAKVINLMDALAKSLDAGATARKPPHRGERRHRAEAAHTAKKRKRSR